MVGVKAVEVVAVEVSEVAFVNVAAEPTVLVAVGVQSASAPVAVGPHTEKVTLPAGAPPVALPVTVTVSDTEPLGPRTIELALAFVVVVVGEGGGGGTGVGAGAEASSVFPP